MKSGRKVAIGLLMGMVLWVARVEAYSYVDSLKLQDVGVDFSPTYFKAHDTVTGGSFLFNMHYIFDTDLPQNSPEVFYHDSFIYLLLTSQTSYEDFDMLLTGGDVTLFDNSSLVDILAPAAFSVSDDFTASRYIYTCFFSDNINPDFWSTVDIDYSLRAVPASAVPEPSTLSLIGLGIAGALLAASRKRR